jgi:hypothetical protein
MSTYRDARPLVVLLLIAGVLVGGTALAREVIWRAGFLVERPTIVVVWLVGLLLGAAVFGWATSRSVRQAGSARSLWLLAVTVGVLASPLLLILLQHPSP